MQANVHQFIYFSCSSYLFARPSFFACIGRHIHVHLWEWHLICRSLCLSQVEKQRNNTWPICIIHRCHVATRCVEKNMNTQLECILKFRINLRIIIAKDNTESIVIVDAVHRIYNRSCQSSFPRWNAHCMIDTGMNKPGCAVAKNMNHSLYYESDNIEFYTFDVCRIGSNNSE